MAVFLQNLSNFRCLFHRFHFFFKNLFQMGFHSCTEFLYTRKKGNLVSLGMNGTKMLKKI